MTTTYEYVITHLYTLDTDPNRPQKVVRALTSVSAQGANQKTVNMNCMFVLQEDGETFTPFDQLIEPVVRSWIDALEEQWNYHKSAIDRILQEPVIDQPQTPTLPWLSTPDLTFVPLAEPEQQAEALAQSTVQNLFGAAANLSDEYIKNLIYQVLEEIKASEQ
jgi:hypothetical protein